MNVPPADQKHLALVQARSQQKAASTLLLALSTAGHLGPDAQRIAVAHVARLAQATGRAWDAWDDAIASLAPAPSYSISSHSQPDEASVPS